MANSIDEDREDPQNKTKKEKSRKPGNTAFRQQRLKAWQPILTPKTVLPLFFIVGIVFAPLGGLLLYANARVQELVIDYTDCESASSKLSPVKKYDASFGTALPPGQEPKWKYERNVKSDVLNDLVKDPDFRQPKCTLNFWFPNDIKPPLLIYYRLTNFYQNHRRYVQSLDESQLKGNARSAKALSRGTCEPLASKDNKPYYPCGLVANSMFNDTFKPVLKQRNKSGDQSGTFLYNMTNEGIAWESDSERYGPTKYSPDDILPPPNWVKRYKGGKYTKDTLPSLHEWEEFQVWMRTAGLPIFSKLVLKNDNDTFETGNYELEIYDRFPVKEYSGTKSVVISTKTVMGGKNPFLGIAYVVVGGLCVLLGALFTARHLIKPRKLGDHTYLSWNNEETSGHTTGRE